jgi:hypothetical protein
MTGEEKKRETIAARQATERAKLLECFKKIPIIQVACEKTGISRATYYRWLEDDPEFREAAMAAIEEGEEFISDKSEGQLIALIGEKNLGAIKHWLDHHRSVYKKSQGRDSTPEQKIRVIILHDNED